MQNISILESPAHSNAAKPLMQRFWNKVSKSKSGCWDWIGAENSAGYGHMSVRRGTKQTYQLAHRISYEIHKGPIPVGYQIDHLCRNRSCVNPSHLEAVTQSENIRRGAASGILKTHCKNGHKRTPETTRVRQAGKYKKLVCKLCDHERGVTEWAKLKALKAAH